MNSTRFRDEIISFFKTEAPDLTPDLTAQTNLFETGILDSLQIVGLITFIESEFNLSLSYDDLTEDNLKSVDAIVALISKSAAR